MKWMARYFTPPILLGLSLTSVSIAVLYVLYRKDEEDIKSRKSQVEISKRYTIECRVPRQSVPAVIGRGGSMIKDIQNKTGTQVHFKEDNIECPERICIIKGSYESVYLAEKMIKSIIHNQPIIETYVLSVPQKACGKIIGRGGDVIHHIQSVSGAKVTVENTFLPSEPHVERKVTIKGTSKQINTALALVQIKIYEEEEERTQLEASSATRLPRGKSSPRNTVNTSEPNLGQNTEPLILPISEGLIEVYVSAMETPSQFWVQIVGPGINALDKLVSDMNAYYNNKENYEMHKLKSVKVGQTVAAKFSFNKQWYRAEVISLPTNDQCEVFYLDYGDHEIIHHDSVLELRTDFLSLRLQAIECTMANIKSPGIEWTNDECDFFAEITFLAEWKVLHAKVKGFKERTFGYGGSRREGSPIPCVELYNKHGNEEINIGYEMIKEGYAEQEETVTSSASSTLSLFSRGGLSTPPLTKRTLSPDTQSMKTSRKLDSGIDFPSTSTIDIRTPIDISDVLKSEVKEIHLFTPQKPCDESGEIDLMTSKKDETNRFIENEKKVQQNDDRSFYPPNGAYIPLESVSKKRERPWQVSKFSRIAPAGFESDMSEDSDAMELG